MKKFLILLAVLAVLCTGCAKSPTETSAETPAETSAASEEIPEETVVGAPQDLIGSWSSASSGETGYTETITLQEDGFISVILFQDGEYQHMITGTYYVKDSTIYYSITQGADPYEGTFDFRVDGRELFLDDDDGVAHYLRNS